MGDAKQDAEELLNAVMPFAEKMLKKYGEFYPFGAQLTVNGKVVMIAGRDGREMPPSQAIIDLLTDGFREESAAGRVRATALAYDIRVMLHGQTEKTDAVAVDLDHRDSYSVTVLTPYRLARVLLGRQVMFDTAVTEKGKNAIFAPTASTQTMQ